VARLSDLIEVFIKDMLRDSGSRDIEIQRNELANYFECAPSQINYVLTTRFPLERGYIIESRRGGGGSIRIIRIKHNEEDLVSNILLAVGNGISKMKADALIDTLLERKLIKRRESEIMKAALKDRTLTFAGENRNRVRAEIIKSMLAVLMKREA
jgi:transcriptional regulator CtsR